jgi:hypothetical protein
MALEKDDVVIHLRCGDIMTGGGGDQMGFYSFDYYANIINRYVIPDTLNDRWPLTDRLPPWAAVAVGRHPAAGTVYIVGNVAKSNSGTTFVATPHSPCLVCEFDCLYSQVTSKIPRQPTHRAPPTSTA